MALLISSQLPEPAPHHKHGRAKALNWGQRLRIALDAALALDLQWIAPSLSTGNIDDIVDENLQGKYDPTSAWKILELALRCTADKGSQRPTMFEVVMQLKSCLEPEIDSYKSENIYSEGFNVSQETASDIGPFGPPAR
ncbi:hypothetical protein B296_00008129 [Ensete ventricosum]|uniref:Serine-threonine/tyrosine-protein kinase catalytic domain-containing protein n=1 Tax=Ensete ventricosum TaxID=4639 RepID=A0A426ZVB9_ENSVE|nr:hypothetical protein B296_00008129 [Ensete ventricosum]